MPRLALREHAGIRNVLRRGRNDFTLRLRASGAPVTAHAAFASILTPRRFHRLPISFLGRFSHFAAAPFISETCYHLVGAAREKRAMAGLEAGRAGRRAKLLMRAVDDDARPPMRFHTI